MNFEKAVDFVLEHEGGFVDHPDDPGGATNFGVSLRWLRGQNPDAADIDGDGDVDADDIRALTPDTAREFYRQKFWDATHCGQMPAPVGAAVFDSAVNCGPRRAVRFLQAAIRTIDPDMALTVDGLMGPKTLEAVRLTSARKGYERLADAILWERQSYYNRLAGQKRFRTFHLGWTRRVCALRDLLHAA
jgi:lysozyme family protein